MQILSSTKKYLSQERVEGVAEESLADIKQIQELLHRMRAEEGVTLVGDKRQSDQGLGVFIE